MASIQKISPVELRKKIESELDCWELSVAPGGGGAAGKRVKLLLTKGGWLLGTYQDVCDAVTGCSMEGLWESALVKAWRQRNKDAARDRVAVRPLRFGRRSGDIIQPDAKEFSGKPDFSGGMEERSESVSSHSRRLSSDPAKVFIHAQEINTETPRQLEEDKKKRVSYAGRTIEAHHVVEDNVFEKMQLERKATQFGRKEAIAVALNPEFHQRYLSLKRWERESFGKKRNSADHVERLKEIYDDLYADHSLAELHGASCLIIGAVARVLERK